MHLFGENNMLHLKSIKAQCVLLLLLAVIFTVNAKDQSEFDLSPGAVLASSSGLLYVSHPDKGIDAISIESGEVVWHSDDAARPVLIRDGQLLAMANAKKKGEINMVSFDSNSGTILSKKTLEVPSTVIANASEGLDHKFKISANYETNPLGDIQWNHSYKLAQGIASIQDLNAVPKDNKTYGQIKFSQSKMESGKSALSDLTLKILTQKPNPKSVAIEGKFLQQKDGRQFTSLSKNYVLVSQVNDNLSTWARYKWDIYNIKNKSLGSFTHHNSFRPFEVVGDTVLFVTYPMINAQEDKVIRHPFMVNAFSLSSGNKKWSKEIKDHKYQGPVPH
jgi:hypothetical protein